ncbi:hypothetical protein [Nitrosophilus alvini]|uniref:hypothetical protein n=1 Tax=Nitrosophilus alvini TaxID=2714855 RepID=UPI00190C203C|nr:hypothetical protein [Nitrosophilus alvini]
MRKKLISIALIAATANLAVAEEWLTKDTSVGIQAGTMGVVLDYQKKVGEKISVKLSAGGFKYDYSTTVDNVDYDVDLRLLGVGLTLDYHPFSGGFYLSGGGYYNGNKFKFDATPSAGTYTFNGNTYNASDIGYVNGESDLNKFAPYIGIGYDSSLFKEGNIFFTAKAGAMYQGKPKVNLTAVCGPGLTSAECAQLQYDVSVEESRLNDDIEDYRWWPVLSVGLAYRF